jgi:hypothetical protein
MHEISAHEVNAGLLSKLFDLRKSGFIGEYGSGTGHVSDELTEIGTVSQFRWVLGQNEKTPNVTNICHGVIRQWLALWNTGLNHYGTQLSKLSLNLGYDLQNPANSAPFLLMTAAASDPEGVILVSTSAPVRLKEMMSNFDWELVLNRPDEIIATAKTVLDGALKSGAGDLTRNA